MIAWLVSFWSGMALRIKLYALGAAAVLMAVGVLYARFRMARAKAAYSTQRADALAAARKTEISVAESRQRLREKQEKVRKQIAARTERDHFTDQGWGP